MKLVFLFGNGLDIGYGLNTSYDCFYKYLMEKSKKDKMLQDNIVFSKLKEDYQNHSLDLWVDYEIRLGSITQACNDNQKEQFDNDKIYLDECLREYLMQENSKLNSKKINGVEILTSVIPEIGKCQKAVDVKKMTKICDRFNKEHLFVNSISFNYTDTVSKIFEIKENSIATVRILNTPYSNYSTYVKKPFYLHGTLYNGEMIVGVNDETQIHNPNYANDESMLEALVKDRLQTQVGQLNVDTYRRMIHESNIICLYGLSIGKTDKEYWKVIKNRLLENDTLLIIYAHIKNYLNVHVRKNTKIVNEYKNIFFENSDASEKEIAVIKDKIIVEINHDVFSEVINK